ncbi:GNAT family N-acetyltransferase [Glycomyces paridis]|uniref:GNAT family N-acetyltransferase n=1 Tax=Glycomyces paridis TaxID=2126555 RepID=A0A4S8PIW5_9ACTN|nr:GNAT family N-acetyltransferase [Glycomyces paridis]THV30618.1 GNAT family N-acetyltransferase [Glycomyces paridis]
MSPGRLSPSRLRIDRVEAADTAALARVADLFERQRAAETPELAEVPERTYADALRHPPPDSAYRCHLATDGGDALGVLWTYLPQKENRHYVEADLVVDPAHRRRGVGSALLDLLLETARAEGRTEIVVLARIAWQGGPARPDDGPRFLERRGFTAALTEVDRSLDLAAIDHAEEARLWAEATEASGGYEVVSWTGRSPDRYVDGLARIDSRIFAEIPLGDVDLRPREVDADFVRAREQSAEAKGDRLIRTIAVPAGTDEVAANTVIYARDDDPEAHQAITIVDPDHRGHRLGLLVKLANLRLLRERFPETARVWTGNADTNANMVDINDRLGFRPVDARVSYRRDLAA